MKRSTKVYVWLSLIICLCLYPVNLFAVGPFTPSPTDQQSNSELRLRLKNNSFGTGQLVPNDDSGSLGWKNDGFKEPFYFECDAVRSIHRMHASQPIKFPDDWFVIESRDGQCVVGKLLTLDDSVAVVRTSGLGEISLDRANISQIHQANHSGEVLYSGLSEGKPWKPIGKPSDWEFRAGTLTATKQAAAILGDIGLTDRCEINLSLEWKGVPDFVLSLGVSPQEISMGQVVAAARLEVWNRNLVLVRETQKDADLVKLAELNEKNPRVDLSVLLDQSRGLVVVRDINGKVLGKIQVQDAAFQPSTAVHLVNHGPSMTVEKLEVLRWNGSSMLGPDQPSQVILRNNELLNQYSIRSYDPKRGVFVLANATGDTLEHAAQDLVAASVGAFDPNSQLEESPSTKADVESDLVEVVLTDRSRIRGLWLASRDGKLGLQSAWCQTEIYFNLESVVSWIGTENQFTSNLAHHRNGSLRLEHTELSGFLIEDVSQAQSETLRWRPHGCKNSSALNADAQGTIAYRLQLPVSDTGQPTGRIEDLVKSQQQADDAPSTIDDGNISLTTREIVFTSGDTIDGYVKKIDQEGIHFLSNQSQVQFVPHHRLESAWINSMVTPARKRDSEKLQRFLTVPRTQRDDPPTHLLVSIHGDLMRGRLVEMNDRTAKIEVRSQVSEIARDKVAQIIWLRETAEQQTIDRRPDEAGSYQIHVIQQNRGLTFSPTRISAGILHGESELLGGCQVSLQQISQILFGPDISTRVAQFHENPWKLIRARLPQGF